MNNMSKEKCINCVGCKQILEDKLPRKWLDCNKKFERMTVNIKATMPRMWMQAFLSMIKEMENNGLNGHSEIMAFHCDGDGNFNPKFELDTDFNLREDGTPERTIKKDKLAIDIEHFYDVE